MNRTLVFGVIAVTLAMAGISVAGAQSGQKTLAATLDVYVFPSAGQAADQQNKDEAECYQWAVNNTGSDPFSIQKQQAADTQQAQAAQQQASQAGQGAGARGAVRGAAVGALVGEIADDDAGKGAAYGAAVGVVAGRRRGREQQQQAQAQVQAQSQQVAQASQQQIDNFKKAFSVCLESKNYMVKF
jgi:hypothetical protein